jgi:small-conductance mechanosensitive channel
MLERGGCLMSVVRQYDNRVGVTYIYEIIEQVDPVTQEKTKHRKLIGKIDKESNEIIPTGKRGRKSSGKQPRHPLPQKDQAEYEFMYKDVRAQLQKAKERIDELSQEVEKLNRKQEELRSWIEKGRQIIK